MKLTSNTIAATLLSLEGDLTATRWHVALCRPPRLILEWLETLGLVEWQKIGRTRKRVLCVPVAQAVNKIKATPYVYQNDSKPHKTYDNSDTAAKVRVVSDPTGLFRRGAEFPANQVFGGDRSKWVQPDELPLGIVLEDEQKRQWTMTKEGLSRQALLLSNTE